MFTLRTLEMKLIKLISFESNGDGRGQLVSLEGNREIPFPIKRVYYMTNMKPSVPRGFHAFPAMSYAQSTALWRVNPARFPLEYHHHPKQTCSVQVHGFGNMWLFCKAPKLALTVMYVPMY